MTATASNVSSDFHLFSLTGIAFSFSVFLTLVTVYTLCCAIYNLWFHPLARIPGPIFARASGIPYSLCLRRGDIVSWIRELHEKYGEVVRVSPSEVSFISGETAWQDIYGFRTGKNKTEAYLKDRTWFAKPVNGTYSLILADEATHSRMRRNLSHAFSDKALREQEDLVQSYVNLLVQRLHEAVQEGKPIVDIMRWYNYTTFDVIADLSFGESLYCLRDKGYHPWVNMVFASAKSQVLVAVRNKYSLFRYYDKLMNIFVDNSAVMRKREEFFEVAHRKVTDRLEKEADRPDFLSYIQKSQAVEEKALTRSEIDSNAVLFLIAGSETTATMLSGTTYLLLRNPEAYSKLVHHIRSKFASQEQITMEEVNKMDYLIACLQEGLRYYPPVPTGFPRVSPRGGAEISGYYIPEKTSVYMSQHAANHSTRNFAQPDSYVPERWTGDERYKDDNKAVLQPFSFGPRNCLGKNLAYAEMRLIMAKVLFNFDLELVDKSIDWFDQKCFTLWEKPALLVNLKPVQR